MKDYDVGYGKPPEHTRFKKGVCPNPRGRGRSVEPPIVQALDQFGQASVEYREGGKRKKASRAQFTVDRLVASALSGNVADAENILKLRRHAAKGINGEGILRIIVEGGLPPRYRPSRGGPS